MAAVVAGETSRVRPDDRRNHPSSDAKNIMAASDYLESDMKRRDQKTEACPGGLLSECPKV